MPLHVLILAAGGGTRMHTMRPKLLHPCAGLPLIVHPVRAACAIGAASVHVVVGPEGDAIRETLADLPVSFAVQERPTGTADAVAAGCAALGQAAGRLLVINGDCPGVLPSTLESLLSAAEGAAAGVLAVKPVDRRGYGRLRRNPAGALVGIVEAADLDAPAPEHHVDAPGQPAEDSSTDVNGGIYCFELEALHDALAAVDTDNAQSERYLTRVFEILAGRGAAVLAVPHADADEVHGVNTLAELARAEALLRRRTLERLMATGVTVRDPATTWVDVDVAVGADTVLHPGVTLEGSSVVGVSCQIRSGVRVSDSRVGDRVTILDGTIVEGSDVADEAALGPYARLRPGSEIGRGAKVGNFVETKATRLGAGSKASHLSYLGNSRIGENVNIGAGTITCNYDGTHKHETVIEDGAFIGSNTALVAPVRVGRMAYVGAGSTITEDVPDGGLGLGRDRQVNKDGWAETKGKREAD